MSPNPIGCTWEDMFRSVRDAAALPPTHPTPTLIAQNDDPELLEWLAKASLEGGGFIQHLAHAGLVADFENYPLIRPLLIQMRAKCTRYEPSDAVKQEIRERKP